MKKVAFFTLLFLLWGSGSLIYAQRTHALAGGAGTVYYYGDLTDGFRTAFLKPAAGLFYYRYLQPNIAFRAGLSYGVVGASDRLADDPARVARNLEFSSPIFEVSGVVVYEFLKDKNYGNAWITKPFVTPYVFGGINLFYFNPRGKFDGAFIDLQPLGTEGQFLDDDAPRGYTRTQVSLPAGIGLNARIAERVGISVELGYRITLTYYLDDVSTVYPDLDALAEQNPTAARMAFRSPVPYEEFVPQYGTVRGNPNANDGYFFAMLTFNYYLSRYARPD